MHRAVPALFLLVVMLSAGQAASGQPSPDAGPPPDVDVIEVHGVIDPALADYVWASLEEAEADGSTVVLQIDSRGTFGTEALDLAARIRRSRVPVIAWVGPAGARVAGGALLVVYASSLATMAPGAGIGPARPLDLRLTADGESEDDAAEGLAMLRALAPGAGASVDGIDRLEDEALAAGPALDSGAVAVVAPRVAGEAGVLGLIRAIDRREVATAAGDVEVHTLDERRRLADVRFHDLGPWRRLLHAVSTPTAFYVLLVLGLWGIAFELTQHGVGMAGIGGVLALALGGYSLTIVPVGWLGLALLVAGMAMQAADVLIKRVAVFTFLGTALFGLGSWLAWRSVAPAVDVSLWLIVLFTVTGFLFFGFGLTVALKARERVRTSQVGLVGLVGEARADLDPEGAVFVKGTLWRARSNDGRIAKGKRVRVRGIDGLILRVEEETDPG